MPNSVSSGSCNGFSELHGTPLHRLGNFLAPEAGGKASNINPWPELVSWIPMKLSEKFARQESEHTRLARIARRRISHQRVQAIRQVFGIEKAGEPTAPTVAERPHLCDLCGRRFSLPMHLGRHMKAKHKTYAAAYDRAN